jgi:hypothetical protein
LGLPSIGAEKEPWDAWDGVRAADHGQLRLHPRHFAITRWLKIHVWLTHRDDVGVFKFFT